MTFPANWDRYGHTAGSRRNRDMLNCVAAWGGVLVGFATRSSAGELDRGTANVLAYAAELELPVWLVTLDPAGALSTEARHFTGYLLPDPSPTGQPPSIC